MSLVSNTKMKNQEGEPSNSLIQAPNMKTQLSLFRALGCIMICLEIWVISLFILDRKVLFR